MTLEVRKTERESGQNLIRRFAKRVQKSGILVQARNNRFFRRSKSKKMRKRAALRRATLKEEYEKLEKLGKSIK